MTKEEEKWTMFFTKMLKKLMLPKLDKLQSSLDEIRRNIASTNDILRPQP